MKEVMVPPMFKIDYCNHRLLDDFRTDFWESWSFIVGLTCENASVLHTANRISHLHQILSKAKRFFVQHGPQSLSHHATLG